MGFRMVWAQLYVNANMDRTRLDYASRVCGLDDWAFDAWL